MISAVLVLLLQAAPATPTAKAAEPQKKVCRTFAETGSFIRKVKTCRTRAEWARIEEETRDEARSKQMQLATDRGG